MANEPIDITPADSVVPVYLIELTEEEIAEREALAAQSVQEEADRVAAEEAKLAAKASAIAKLAALGLTEEEAAAIAGV
jgi:hypothetical protein